MKLVETLSFKEMYDIQKPFFKDVLPTITNKSILKTFVKTEEYYHLDENPMHINNAAFEMTSLNRYYVFKKNGTKKFFKEFKK